VFAARLVFSFTPSSASSERVLCLKNLFGENQDNSLADYAQAAVMLRYNKRDI